MNPILSETDYTRLVGILSAIVKATGAEPARACVTFAVAGSWALRHVYRVNAIPLVGAAFYRVDDRTGFTMAYGHYLQGQVISDESAFHCWIVCEGHVIDLSAPLMPDNLALSRRSEVVPRKMFQRPLSDMAVSPLALEREGDFYLEPNLPLSQRLLSNYLSDPSYLELAQLCAHWFDQLGPEVTDTFRIPGKNGPSLIRRHDITLDGIW